MELFRREMIKEAAQEEFEDNFVRNIVLVAREMSWDLDYVLDLGITQYNEVNKVLKWDYERQERAMRSKARGGKAQTLG